MFSQTIRNLNPLGELELKERERKYKIHVRRIQEIISKESKIKEIKVEHKRVLHSLQRSKEIAKNFKADEDKRKRTTQNIKLVCSLIDIKTKPRMLTEWRMQEDYLESRKSKTPKKERRLQTVEMHNANQKLAKSIIEQSINVKKYKKRLKNEISEYLKLRGHLQKMKTIESYALPSTPRKSQKLIEGKTSSLKFLITSNEARHIIMPEEAALLTPKH